MSEKLYVDLKFLKDGKRSYIAVFSIFLIGAFTSCISLFIGVESLFNENFRSLSFCIFFVFGIASFILKLRTKRVVKMFILELVNNKHNDERLSETINTIYKLRGGLTVYDLKIIRDSINKKIDDDIDIKIKNGSSIGYTHDEIEKMKASEILIFRTINLLD